jgi:hypothetical protein
MHSQLIAQPAIRRGVAAEEVYYVDATQQLGSKTIASITSATPVLVGGSGANLTLANPAVLATAHDYEDGCGSEQTIAIGKGLQYECSEGAYGASYLITFVVVNSSGETMEFGQRVEM